MKVLYVCADRGVPLLGNKGASVHLRSITGAMQLRGHQVGVVARRWEEGNDPPAVTRLERLAKEPEAAVEQLDRLIAAISPDVVIERYSLESGATRTATRRHGLPLVLELNAPLAEEAIRFRGLDDPGAVDTEHATLRAADRIHVVSSALERYVRSVAPGVPVAVVPNGADVRRLRSAAPAELPGAAGRVLVGFAGSMKPWHGVEDLLDAFARIRPRHPEAALALVGGGPLLERLTNRADQPDLRGSVLFTGQVPHTHTAALLARFDIGAAPYLPLDGFYFNPLKVVEYLAAGRPVVYADQGDLRELVGDGGLGYEPGSIDGLADRLGALLVDPGLRARLAGAAALRGAALDWGVIADRVLAFASGELATERAA